MSDLDAMQGADEQAAYFKRVREGRDPLTGAPDRVTREREALNHLITQTKFWADQQGEGYVKINVGMAKRLIAALSTPQAGGEQPRFGDPCPHCDGGEVHVPSSVPGDEGWQTCPTCNGRERLPTVDEFRDWKIQAEAAMGDLAVAEARIKELSDRLAPQVAGSEESDDDLSVAHAHGYAAGYEAARKQAGSPPVAQLDEQWPMMQRDPSAPQVPATPHDAPDEMVDAFLAAREAGHERFCLACWDGFSGQADCPNCATPPVAGPEPIKAGAIHEALRELRARMEGFNHYGDGWSWEEQEAAEAEYEALPGRFYRATPPVAGSREKP